MAAKKVEFNRVKTLRVKTVSTPKNVFASAGKDKQTIVQFKNTNRPKARRIPNKTWFCHGQSRVCFEAILKRSSIPRGDAFDSPASPPRPVSPDGPATVTFW